MYLKAAHETSLAFFDLGVALIVGTLRLAETHRRLVLEWKPAAASPVPSVPKRRTPDQRFQAKAMVLYHIPAGDPPGMGRL